MTAPHDQTQAAVERLPRRLQAVIQLPKTASSKKQAATRNSKRTQEQLQAASQTGAGCSSQGTAAKETVKKVDMVRLFIFPALLCIDVLKIAAIVHV
jgi:hypothetical protein